MKKRARTPWLSLTDRKPLGKKLEVGPVCLGMVDTPSVVLSAYEAGINFFFVTADMHWPLYEPLREGLRRLLRTRGVREKIVVCAAAYVTQPDFCSAPFQEVLEAIPGLDYLDVLTAGGVYAADFSARLPVYRAHRDEKFLGCTAIAGSFHDRPVARFAIEHGVVDLGFVRFNPGHPGAKRDVFPYVAQRESLLYGFKSVDGWLPAEYLEALGLEKDTWRPEAVDHYRYALSHAGLDGVLVALRHSREVRALAEALTRGPLSPSDQAYMESIAEAVSLHAGPRGG